MTERSRGPRRAAPGTAEDWAALFDTLPYYGDGMQSVRLDRRRVMFVTGDAVPRSGSAPWAHSTVTVVTDMTSRLIVGAPRATSIYQVVPNDETGDAYHWLGPVYACGGVVRSLAPYVAPSAGGFGFTSLGTHWARFDVDWDVRFRDLVPTGHTVYDPVHWASGVWYDAPTNWVYVFGTSREPTDGWTGHDVYVARARPGRIDHAGSTHWHYLADGLWSRDADDASPVMRTSDNGGTESAFSVWRDVDGWHVAGRRGGLWGTSDLVMWTTWALEDVDGPWNERVLAPLPDGAYLPWVHPTVRLADHRAAATYCVPGRPATWLAVDVD